MCNISKCGNKTPNNCVNKTGIWSNNATMLIIHALVHAGNGAFAGMEFLLRIKVYYVSYCSLYYDRKYQKFSLAIFS